MFGSSTMCGMSALCSWKWSSSKGRKSSAVCCGPFSSTSTFQPRCVRTRAAVPPPAPAPTMIASKGSGIATFLLRVRGGGRAPEHACLVDVAEPVPHRAVAVPAPPGIGEAALDRVAADGSKELRLVDARREASEAALRELSEQVSPLVRRQLGDRLAVQRLCGRVEGREPVLVELPPARDLVVRRVVH